MKNKIKATTIYLCKPVVVGLFIILISTKLFATPQAGDRLIYNGKVFSVWLLYLPDEFYKSNTVVYDTFEYIDDSILAINLFGYKETCYNTACGRGYIAEWEIIDDILYLTGIYSCCYYRDSIKADLTALFKEKVVNGKVKADWITGNFLSPQGKRIRSEYSSIHGGFYEYELEFYFEKGELTETRLYDNTASKLSIYCQDPKKLEEFIYSNINWKIIPKQDTTIVVNVYFITNENGLIDEARTYGYNELYDQEAIRVVKLVPEWDVYFSRGKLTSNYSHFLVIFSEENRLKYEK